jgi:hypothetical protein
MFYICVHKTQIKGVTRSQLLMWHIPCTHKLQVANLTLIIFLLVILKCSLIKTLLGQRVNDTLIKMKLFKWSSHVSQIKEYKESHLKYITSVGMK